MNTKATFTPAVTETKTVEVSPAKVTLELTLEQAGKLKALAGDVYAGDELNVYSALHALGKDIPEYRTRLMNGGRTSSVTFVAV